MKKVKLTILSLAVIAVAAIAFAAENEKVPVPAQTISQKELVQRFGFIDENGDGINDLARDADNDGIPNCLDPDWVCPKDGSGYKNQYGYKHQNANIQNRGGSSHFAYSYNYLWSNDGGGGNSTNVCNNTGPNGNQRRNRKTRRGH
ncbi:MAG TPA: hypothetical protein VMZ49_01630 [Patescibacteria group bacterium]|nr:hypothetical protein [Patescibacteria group bacterium]